MASNATSETNLDFLVLSNPFSGESTSKDVVAPVWNASKIYQLIKLGHFGFDRERIVAAFTAGSKTFQRRDLKRIIGLCLEVEAESNRNSRAALRLWFDPFSGRLELESANGLRDSLCLFASAHASA